MIKVEIPATTANMGSGFDCIGAALDLTNEIILEKTNNNCVEVKIVGEGADIIEKGENNLVVKAMKKVYDAAGLPLKGLKATLINKIPIARGLGSSAACIVGGLAAANEILGKPFSKAQLLNMAVSMEGHPDNVVPAMLGGVVTSIVDENGGVKHIKLAQRLPFNFVVIVPDFLVKTEEARKVLPKTISHKDAVFNVGRASLLAASLALGKFDFIDLAVEDKLHQPFRAKLIPYMELVIKRAKHLGARACYLSGAGPSIVAITNEEDRTIGKSLKEVYDKNGINCSVYYTKLISSGVKISGVEVDGNYR